LITGDQIRAARALLKWSAADLAEASDIGIATVRRLEVMEGVPSGQVRVLTALKEALEKGGVVFTGTPDHQPGVHLK
jgi:transcriptional regulator with XRE-family HTH domain